jgi:drug/metabolite transporter (DMT)-like permease
VAAADLVLVLANLVYATSALATRLTLDHVPPATLALLRLVIAAAVLLPLSLRQVPAGFTRLDHARLAAMGIVGFAAAYALSHWGLARSTVTNAALLIAVEPLTLLALGPLLLGERLSGREKIGAAAAVAGAVVVVVNGIPGVTAALLPHWRGDLLLVLAGVAYAAYTLVGRPVLRRRPALAVTTWSIAWGIPALAPLVIGEWIAGARAEVGVGAGAVIGTLYLGGVITGLGYLVWNRALEHVSAARAAVFLNVQPVGGALLGVLVLGEPLTPFTVAGALLVVGGLLLIIRPGAGPGNTAALRVSTGPERSRPPRS